MTSLETLPQKPNQFEGHGNNEAPSDWRRIIKLGNTAYGIEEQAKQQQAWQEVWEVLEQFYENYKDTIDFTKKEFLGEIEVLQGIVDNQPGNLAAKERLDDLEERRKNPDSN